ncbi:MAG: hypothetical protein P8J27_04080 [Mariniblastus sp.]|nr:hypothetical protein [Mariniblastus sp.]
MIVPFFGDVDNDGKGDSLGKHLMFNFMASQEGEKAKAQAFKDETQVVGSSDSVGQMKQGFDKKSEDKTEEEE